ncbi:hypothetical protein ACFWOB_37375 [Streptomyces sp. NPDC058420]|uniref:hypothetical protein n=1 Tax=Streptomyces sp. NPDC058420 TaxID=3346489 RepID=UPI00365A8EDE
MNRIDHAIKIVLSFTAILVSISGCMAQVLALKEMMAVHNGPSVALCAMATASFTASAALAGLHRRHDQRTSVTDQTD